MKNGTRETRWYVAGLLQEVAVVAISLGVLGRMDTSGTLGAVLLALTFALFASGAVCIARALVLAIRDTR